MSKPQRNDEARRAEMNRRKVERASRVSGQLMQVEGNFRGGLALVPSPNSRPPAFYKKLLGRTKFTGQELRKIRAQKTNFHGQGRR